MLSRGRRQRSVRVAIIGAGMSGIAVAERLKRSRFENFDLYEQSDGVGGTWHDARYPGAAVDTAQPMYSYSFTKHHSFTRMFAGQQELLAYLEQTVDALDLRPHCHLGVGVTSVEWSQDKLGYLLTLTNGESEWYDAVVSSVGYLNNPRYPDWPHMDEFAGDAFHSSRWSDTSLRGKRVALVGTGSAAAQITGAIAPEVAELLVFQRQAGWVLPKPDRMLTDEEHHKIADGKRRNRIRRKQYIDRYIGGVTAHAEIELDGGLVFTYLRAKWRQRRQPPSPQQVAENYIASIFADRPDLRELVTPHYRLGGKRVVKDSSYYEALLRDNVRLIPRAVDDVYAQGVIDAEGEKHEVDVIVMATGYQTSDLLGTIAVKGRDGRWLKDVWNGEPAAFMGLTIPGLPNFFMTYGPNTNSAFLAYLFESQAAYIARSVGLLRRGVKTIEVRKRWHDVYNDRIQRKLANSAIAKAREAGVHTYFATESGRIVGYMPMTNATYGVLLRLLGHLSTTKQR
jgi:cation diffusion facilitator CzcD-associated flavoprotein CzcO